MSTDKTRGYIEAAAAILDLDIREEWMPNVIGFFDVARKMASDVIASDDLTDAEAAPVFVPRSVE
jgi:hypothetical protein